MLRFLAYLKNGKYLLFSVSIELKVNIQYPLLYVIFIDKSPFFVTTISISNPRINISVTSRI